MKLHQGRILLQPELWCISELVRLNAYVITRVVVLPLRPTGHVSSSRASNLYCICFNNGADALVQVVVLSIIQPCKPTEHHV